MGISSAGLGSGLDVNSIVTQLVQLEKRSVTTLSTRKSEFNSQLSAFGRIKSDLDAFRTTLNTLKLDQDFALTKATSTDSTLLTATTTTTAVAGSYDIKVKTLAQAGVQASIGQTSSTAAIGAANFDSGGPSDITFTAAGKSFAVSVAATDSLETVRDKINNAVISGDTSAQALAKASIVNVGTSASPSYKLVVAATQSGVDNDVSVSSGDVALRTYFGFSAAQPATNATISINGLDVQRSSNTLSDVIDGVTLKLGGADTNKTVTLTVAKDTEAITKKLEDFVAAYNKLAGTVSSLHQKGGTLEADNTATAVIYGIQGAFNSAANIAGGNYSWLSQVGISFKKDGTLALDKDTFNKALASDPQSVTKLFTDSTNGISQRLSNTVSGMLNTDGLVDARISGINARIKTIDNRIDRENDRIGNFETRLRAQYARLDAALGTMKNSTGFLSALQR